MVWCGTTKSVVKANCIDGMAARSSKSNAD